MYYDALLMVNYVNHGRPAFSLLELVLRIRDWLREWLRWLCAWTRFHRRQPLSVPFV